MDLEKDYEKIKKLIKEKSEKSYEYEYILSIEIDEERNSKYGKSRKGYEQFKRDYPHLYPDIPNDSLRPIINRETSKIEGFVLEKQQFNNELNEEIRELFNSSLDSVIEYFNGGEVLRDFLMQYIITDYSAFSTSYVEQMESLKEIVADYKEDEKFKKLIDTLAKAE